MPTINFTKINIATGELKFKKKATKKHINKEMAILSYCKILP